MNSPMITPRTIRWRLLSTVSALALLACAGEAEAANDADHPQIWIELGGQTENISGQGESFTPAFLAGNIADPSDPFTSFFPPSSQSIGPPPTFSVLRKGVTPVQAQKPPPFSFGEEAKALLRPEGSDWVVSAAIRFGRSSNSRNITHQTDGGFHSVYVSGEPRPGDQPHQFENFAETRAHRDENHLILDFTVGKDVGLGFGGSSVLSGGVRIAQFTSDASFDIRARPDLQFKYQSGGPLGRPEIELKLPFFQTNHATGSAIRSFHGVGPSVSWNGSMPVTDHVQDEKVTFDWGINAAVLFGKQRARVRHHESEHFANPYFFQNAQYYTAYNNPVGGHTSRRSVTVPNVGGFAGLSWRVQDFKVSLGYRADFFFGAIDGGIDARKSETLGFKGPFASISVGIP